MVAKVLPAGRSRRSRKSTFAWEGRDRTGKTLRGETRAGGQTIVVSALRRQGIIVTKIKKQRYKATGGRIKDADISLFTRQLSTMMKAGVPLLQAFDIVAKGTDKGAVAKLFTTSRAMSRPAPRSHAPSANTRSISTVSTATWSAQASRRASWTNSSIASPPTRKRSRPSRARSNRRSSIRSRFSWWPSSWWR
jgi:hypothetical protein